VSYYEVACIQRPHNSIVASGMILIWHSILDVVYEKKKNAILDQCVVMEHDVQGGLKSELLQITDRTNNAVFVIR